MTLWTAILLLFITVVAIVLTIRCLKNRVKLRNICLVLLSLTALLLVIYILLIWILISSID